MPGLVELWAHQVGWQVRAGNVIVEGTTDVSILEIARELHLDVSGVDIFGSDFAILAAGRGDDGGVDGVNRRLNAARQFADVDTTSRYRFIGLFDNDEAGRRAISRASNFDRRIVRYQDVFLLHPKMPLANGADGPAVEKRATALNQDHQRLDWEIEDLLSEDLRLAFEEEYPHEVIKKTTIGGRTHRDLTRAGKSHFVKFVRDYATAKDVIELVHLTRALRDYCRLRYDHIVL